MFKKWKLLKKKKKEPDETFSDWLAQLLTDERELDHGDGMAEPAADAAAEIEPETGGFPVRAAVVAGKALFADPRDIFRCDPDACVADNESFRSFI